MLLVLSIVVGIWFTRGKSVPRGMTPQMRQTKASAEIAEIGKAVAIHLMLTGRMPASLADLRRPLARNGGEPIIVIGDDPWGRPYHFTVDGPRAVTVTCLGADGAPGGNGEDEDIVIHSPARYGQEPR